jgi:uncharacterized membrane protein YqgA involved in biofilm formation
MNGLGTIINALVIVVAGGIGSMFRGKLRPSYQKITMEACGLIALVWGFVGLWDGLFTTDGESLMQTKGMLLVIFALLVGTMFGIALGLDKGLDRIGKAFCKIVQNSDRKEAEHRAQREAAVASAQPSDTEDVPATAKKRRSLRDLPTYDLPSPRSGDRFLDGFAISTLLVSVGTMLTRGAYADATGGDMTLLYVKIAVDFVLILLLSTVFGVSVSFSAVPLLVLQGGFTVLAMATETFVTPALISQVGFVGSVMIVLVGFNLCFGKKLRVGNMLPALAVPIIYTWIVVIATKMTEK